MQKYALAVERVRVVVVVVVVDGVQSGGLVPVADFFTSRVGLDSCAVSPLGPSFCDTHYSLHLTFIMHCVTCLEIQCQLPLK